MKFKSLFFLLFIKLFVFRDERDRLSLDPSCCIRNSLCVHFVIQSNLLIVRVNHHQHLFISLSITVKKIIKIFLFHCIFLS